mgnify:CR=1 FL=1
MRLGLIMGMGNDWRKSLETIKIAEQLGYEMVVTGEAWGPSAIPWLTAIALNTSTIQIGSSILNCFSRSPAAIAQEFATMEVLSQGRMILGLGSSGGFVIEHFHGIPYSKPLRRLREYVEIFNLLISGERLHYSGELFQMDRGFQLHFQRVRERIPIYIAAISPRSIRQTGEIADGIYPIHWPKERLTDLRETLRVAAINAGRPGDKLVIAPQIRVTILDGTNDEAKWMSARQPLHHYINRMGRFYWEMLERNGFEAEVAASKDAWAQRDLDGALNAISPRMVRSTHVIGTLEEVREQLHERAELGADIQILSGLDGVAEDVRPILESLVT